MFGRKLKHRGPGVVDGVEGRGIALGGHDRRPPTGYNVQEDEWIEELREFSDRDFAGDEEGGGPDRRRDPLRH
jgi:hypothetical protein